ncbi:hypothetical protein Tco_1276142 [Tanacetum coccineum]
MSASVALSRGKRSLGHGVQKGYIGDTVMSDSEDSTVTYTAVSSPFEDGSDIGSPGVDGPPIMPEDPYAYIMAAYVNMFNKPLAISN